jgi:putative NADH-flavin reductase
MAQHKLLVIGATGPSGREIVKQAVAAGHTVTAFARNPARAGFGPEVKLVTGDVRDPVAVAAAIKGHDVVLSALGNNRQRKNPPCAEGMRTIVAGMQAAGVRRLIAISAYGTGDSRHGFYGWMINMVLGEVERDKEAMEQVMEQSGLDWTAVRSPALTAGPLGAPLKAAPDVVLKGMPSISMADQARFILDEIDARRFVGAKPILYRA